MKDHARVRSRPLHGVQGVRLEAGKRKLLPVHAQVGLCTHGEQRQHRPIRSLHWHLDLEGCPRLLRCDCNGAWAAVAVWALAAVLMKAARQRWQELVVAVIQPHEHGMGKTPEEASRIAMLCSPGLLLRVVGMRIDSDGDSSAIHHVVRRLD